MTFTTSAIVGGQALADTGRLTESYGPVALTARAKSYGGPATETILHARGPDQRTQQPSASA
ncbi:hypothetical protein ACWC09_20565 [Streptomyces sp. NPDC001617]